MLCQVGYLRINIALLIRDISRSTCTHLFFPLIKDKEDLSFTFIHRNTQHLLRCQTVIQSNKWPHQRVRRARERRMVTSLGGRRQAVRPAVFKERICWRSLKMMQFRSISIDRDGTFRQMPEECAYLKPGHGRYLPDPHLLIIHQP